MTQQQVAGLPQGVTHVSPVYPVSPQAPSPVPTTKPWPPSWAFVVAAAIGGAIAWMGAAGFYGAADVRAMELEVKAARAATAQAQAVVEAQGDAISQAREVLSCE